MKRMITAEEVTQPDHLMPRLCLRRRVLRLRKKSKHFLHMFLI
jgi:hypothetical protein